MIKKLQGVCLLISSLLTLLLLPACSTYKPIPPKIVSLEFRDTVRIYEKDSVMVERAGDTVYVDRWHTRYKDREVVKEVPVEVEVQLPPERYVPKFYEVCTLAFWGLLVVVMGVVLLLVVLRR